MLRPTLIQSIHSLKPARVRRKYWALTILGLLAAHLAGCATVGTERLHTSLQGSGPRDLPQRIALLPVEVTVSELFVGGISEEVEEWSEQAERNVVDALTGGNPHTPVVAGLVDFSASAEQQATIDEHIALYGQVAGSAYWATTFGGAGWQHKRAEFDYTLGDGLAFLEEETGATAGLIVIGNDEISSAGRKTAVVFAAMLGAAVPGGTAFLSAGLIELRTGNILWFDYKTSVGGRDLRVPDDAAALVKALFASFPVDEGAPPFDSAGP